MYKQIFKIVLKSFPKPFKMFIKNQSLEYAENNRKYHLKNRIRSGSGRHFGSDLFRYSVIGGIFLATWFSKPLQGHP